MFKVAVNTLGKIVDETLESNNLQKSDVKWLVPHQANIRIIAARQKARAADGACGADGGSPRQHLGGLDPLAFDEAVRDGRIQRGDMVLMEAFGGGFTWGSVLLKY